MLSKVLSKSPPALVVTVVTALTACLVGPAPALAATAVTVQTVYENTPISVNMSDAVGYEFTNTTAAPETVSFTDTLPNGVTVDNPPALTNTAGTGTCIIASASAGAGASTVSLDVEVPPASAAGVICTISVSVVTGAPSAADAPLTDAYTNLTATPHTAALSATPGGLIVLSDPTLTVTAPQDGQVFALSQLFDAEFSCAASDPLDSVDSFFGTDDRGNQIASGEPIDTVDPGPHTLDVECYSAAGGGYVADTVNYTVGSYALTRVRVSRQTGQVSFRTQVPAGKLVAKVLDGKTVIGTTATTVPASETLGARVVPTRSGLKSLRTTRGRSVKLELETSFTPAPIGTGDAEITPTSPIKLTRGNIRLSLAAIR